MAKSQFNDLGLGTKAKRLITKEGKYNVKRTGHQEGLINTYQKLITMDWFTFLLLALVMVLLLNCAFATLYFFIGVEHFTGIESTTFVGQYLKCLFFSLQTFTTVGYGYIAPKGIAVSILAAFEALTGLMVFAIITGLLYGRFAKPTAKIQFSDTMLVAPYQDGWSYQFRVINRRNSLILDLHARVLLSYAEKGKSVRSFFTLELEREKVVLFPLNWTIVHPLTEKSPLWKKTQEELIHMDTEIIIVLKGYDDTFSQEVNSIYSYKASEFVYGAKFETMYETDNEGTVLQIDKLSRFQKISFPS